MPRPLRPQGNDIVYHLTTRGNRRQPIYVDDADRTLFLDLLQRAVDRYGWLCHSYCLMPNHFHVVCDTPQANVSEGMQYLNGRYAQAFNWRHGYDGHLFQGRFHSELVESDRHLAGAARYVVLNPVRAGLCASPGEWRWSSYRATVGTVPTPAFLSLGWLGQFGRDEDRARVEFARFVAEAPHLAAAA